MACGSLSAVWPDSTPCRVFQPPIRRQQSCAKELSGGSVVNGSILPMEPLWATISLNLGDLRQQLVPGRVASGNGSTDYTTGKRGMANQSGYACRTRRLSHNAQMLVDETKSQFHGLVADQNDVINNTFKVRERFRNRNRSRTLKVLLMTSFWSA